MTPGKPIALIAHDGFRGGDRRATGGSTSQNIKHIALLDKMCYNFLNLRTLH